PYLPPCKDFEISRFRDVARTIFHQIGLLGRAPAGALTPWEIGSAQFPTGCINIRSGSVFYNSSDASVGKRTRGLHLQAAAPLRRRASKTLDDSAQIGERFRQAIRRRTRG